jgi:hypothetical protein
MLAAQEKHEQDFRHDFHRRSDPFASPLWRIVDVHYDTFERVYPERYAPKYGFLRPALLVVVDKFSIRMSMRSSPTGRLRRTVGSQPCPSSPSSRSAMARSVKAKWLRMSELQMQICRGCLLAAIFVARNTG